jgi:hypothetical protein
VRQIARTFASPIHLSEVKKWPIVTAKIRSQHHRLHLLLHRRTWILERLSEAERLLALRD